MVVRARMSSGEMETCKIIIRNYEADEERKKPLEG